LFISWRLLWCRQHLPVVYFLDIAVMQTTLTCCLFPGYCCDADNTYLLFISWILLWCRQHLPVVYFLDTAVMQATLTCCLFPGGNKQQVSVVCITAVSRK
jgi:hypothetical protein